MPSAFKGEALVKQSLANALVEMAETNLMNGESLPQPNASISDPEADLSEPIDLESSI